VPRGRQGQARSTANKPEASGSKENLASYDQCVCVILYCDISQPTGFEILRLDCLLLLMQQQQEKGA